MNLKVQNALISVSNKENLISLLKVLKKYNINIISSGGTYASIKKMGYECVELSKYTGFREMLDGRVKTLHPKIHAGILHDRQNKKHKNEMSKQNFPAIDLIVVNFYPFQKIVTNTKNPKKIIENNKTESTELIYQEFQKQLPIYGFGDLQIKHLLMKFLSQK